MPLLSIILLGIWVTMTQVFFDLGQENIQKFKFRKQNWPFIDITYFANIFSQYQFAVLLIYELSL